MQESRPTRKAMRKAQQRLKQWLRPDTDELSLGSVARTNDVTLLCVLNRI